MLSLASWFWAWGLLLAWLGQTLLRSMDLPGLEEKLDPRVPVEHRAFKVLPAQAENQGLPVRRVYRENPVHREHRSSPASAVEAQVLLSEMVLELSTLEVSIG
jgi:hypothetical protein